MEKYFALLRGVNVGGKNKVPMSLLKSIFEAEGFCNVSTYINSGNVLFESDDADTEALQLKCEQIINAKFDFNIPVAVVSAISLAEILKNAPDWWDVGKDSKHNAIFVISPKTVESVLDDIGETKPERELIANYKQVIFWSAPTLTYTRTRLSKIVSTSSYASITIRNANTTKKLLQLASQIKDV